MARTTFKQKLALILFGLLLGIVLLEVGLRAGGFVFSWWQERANLRALKEKGEYIILCLGESTTAFGGEGSYPRQLEKVLNGENTGLSFSVINKGVPGSNSASILAQLQENIDRYRPDIIITMMGINDMLDTLGTMVYENTLEVKRKLFLKSFRVYKLTKLLQKHIASKLNEIKGGWRRKKAEKEVDILLRKAEGKRSHGEENLGYRKDRVERGDWYLELDDWEEALPFYKEALRLEPGAPEVLLKLGVCYREIGEDDRAEAIFGEVLKRNPEWAKAYLELGELYRGRREWEKAEDCYRKAVEADADLSRTYVCWSKVCEAQGKLKEALLKIEEVAKANPESMPGLDRQYLRLASTYHQWGEYEEAERLYKKAIEINPGSDSAYAELGRFYEWQGRLQESEEMCRKAIEINPCNDTAYSELGILYASAGDWEKGEEMYQKSFELNPFEHFAFSQLMTHYMREKDFDKIIPLCNKVIEVRPDHDLGWSALALCYEAQGQKELADQQLKKAEKVRAKHIHLPLAQNYRKLREIVAHNGIQLVCSQYAMRSIQDLKRMFPDSQGIIFVDNEEIFKKAVREEGYDKYFIDTFGGDFGHCNPKGNRLLAENIAGVILKEVAGINPENRP